MNVELLNRVVNQIESHPESWDQDRWIDHNNGCGTTACVAGWTCLLSGWESRTGSLVTKGGEAKLVPEAAREELGFSVAESAYLFSSERSFGEIKEFVDRFSQPPPLH